MELNVPIVSQNILNNEGYNDILDSIDTTIADICAVQYKNHVLGYQYYVDYELYDQLCTYREIFMDKFMGCNCLTEEYTIYILSKIQKLTC